MINTCTFSKELITFIVCYVIRILTVTCDSGTDQNVIVEIKIRGRTFQDLLAGDNNKEFGQQPVRDHDEEIITKQQIDQIMGSIQLGIKHEIKSIASKPQKKSLPDDFNDVLKLMFYNWHDTNNNIQYPDFFFFTYAPFTFQYLRGLFGIDPNDYVTSFCNSPLRELSNPGASKSKFYLTPDDKFFMKTLQQTEDECLLKLLSSYSTYFRDNQESLLPKFSGFYGIQCKSINLKLVSMNNLLPSNIKMHQKFDLKGSTLGREASDYERNKKLPTFKDLDFTNEHHPKGIFLKPSTRLALLETIKRDCKILKDLRIMDYSILMGIYNIDHPLKTMDHTSSKTYTLKLAAEYRWESLMADLEEHKSSEADAGTLSGENDASLRGSIPAKSANGNRLLLFVGIIDILQTFRKRKSLERSFKTLKLLVTPGVTESADSISVQNPEFYASRFIKYMTDSVFMPMLSPQELDELANQPIDIPL